MDSAELVGRWTGTNGFRLMPGDELRELPAAVVVTAAAGGHLVLVAYDWQHPDDGPQDGLIVVGPVEDRGDGPDGGDGVPLTATWGDSWHQKPAPMTLSGRQDADGGIVLEGRYAGDWGWRVLLDADPGGGLRLRMDNVVPADQASGRLLAGPYPAMVLRAHRA
ncbi:hypothetical protein [Cellulomonas sp. PhB143]|uniref:hypothetical protein n=1 Tax=Cellulomonas sp. PhB143 TaxID=2485186 RepID=UPI000F4A803D|nr:hypothetical protein [Cellulomonas sp. PhB143]ROS76461.1 hypothetical protein EDF32_1274 [Cellulomonas sp. PhB143]